MEKKLTDLLPGSQGRHVQLSGRDRWDRDLAPGRAAQHEAVGDALHVCFGPGDDPVTCELPEEAGDRKSTRLNSSHVAISYAVVCLQKIRTRKITMVTFIRHLS